MSSVSLAQLLTLPVGESEGTFGQRRRLTQGFWQQAAEAVQVGLEPANKMRFALCAMGTLAFPPSWHWGRLQLCTGTLPLVSGSRAS